MHSYLVFPKWTPDHAHRSSFEAPRGAIPVTTMFAIEAESEKGAVEALDTPVAGEYFVVRADKIATAVEVVG